MTTANRGGDAVSILDSMTKSTIARHTAAAPKPSLTTLMGEDPGASIIRPQALPSTPAPFPYDKPGPELLVLIAGLETQRAALTAVIDALRLLAGDPVVVANTVAKDKATAQALLEKEADRRIAEGAPTVEQHVKEVVEARDTKRAAVLEAMIDADAAESFQERLDRISKEAQDHVFTPDIIAAAITDGWTCPRHGQAVTKTSARRNRDYQACPVAGCGKFEAL